MKKQGTILLVAATLMLVEVPVEAATAASRSNQSTVSDLFGKKRKGAKPRRGGLFNTGIFRKKNPCGCPNH